VAAAAALVGGASPAVHTPAPAPAGVEVVVTLRAPALVHSGVAAFARGTRKLDVHAPASTSYTRRLASAQRTLAARIERAIPAAEVRWHYRVLVDGIAVVVPPGRVSALERIPGVAAVYPSVTYRQLVEPSVVVVGAQQVWGPTLSTAGQGMKIGVIDDGVDQRHPFFDPSAFTMPAGFPKGQASFTTAKVIVARAFPPPHSTYPPAALPFDPAQSEHGTHVAGIAAGDPNTTATNVPGRGTVPGMSGIAPDAYIGNYKVLGTPTDGGVGIDGNSAEIVAGIEAAVSDGMDVINLSLGEPEIEPSRDIVTKAIDAAADAGVVPAIAAGNDREEFGNGSVGSPGSAAKAITAAALFNGSSIASFSSGGPTPISLRMKPDVGAPCVSITSSVPASRGTWAQFSGTSMASPHIAGGAALLKQRHPTWTVAQIKSAIVQTAQPVRPGGVEAPTTLEGGGAMYLPAADVPLVFAAPTGLSFGLLRAGANATATVSVTDAGGGAGPWAVAVRPQSSEAGVTVSVPASVTVPGSVAVHVAVGASAAERDLTGFVVLTRGTTTRRIPYWFRVERPKLRLDPHGALSRTGTYNGNTAGHPARVTSYRYPDGGAVFGFSTRLAGPEQVFRFALRRPVANFGVAVLSRRSGRVHVEPRIVAAGDENRLTGYAGLPLNINPYLEAFSTADPVAAAIRPKAGAYDIVFDTPSRAAAGGYTFRFWIDDNAPPSIRVVARTVASGAPLRLAITDAGSGVEPRSLSASVDGATKPISLANGRATVKVGALSAGSHRLVVTASDHQEAKNMENVAPVLPNTRVLRTTFTVR